MICLPVKRLINVPTQVLIIKPEIGTKRNATWYNRSKPVVSIGVLITEVELCKSSAGHSSIEVSNEPVLLGYIKEPIKTQRPNASPANRPQRTPWFKLIILYTLIIKVNSYKWICKWK